MPDSNWVPSHRLNKATGEEKRITTKCESRNQDHCTDSGQANWLPNSSVPGPKLRCANLPAFGSAWLCQQSYVSNRNFSVARPSSVCVAFIAVPNTWISFKVWLLHPLVHTLGCFFLIFWKNSGFFYEYFSFSLTWVPIGAKISKRYSSYISHPKALKLLLNFLPEVPHKNVFGIGNVGPYRSEKFKTLPL